MEVKSEAKQNKPNLSIKRFFSNYLTISCILLSLVYFFSGYLKWLEWAVIIFAGIFFLCVSAQKSFCLFLFLHNFINSNFTVAYSFRFIFNIFTIILSFKYLVGLIRKKYKFHTRIFLLLLTIFVIGCIISIPEKKYYASEAYLSYLPLFYLFFAMRKEFYLRQAMKYFLFGFVLSCGLAWLSIILPNYSYEVEKFRFGAFAENPNYLYMRALIIICYYMHLFLTDNLPFVKLAPIFMFSAFITLSTRSKTGICMLLFICLIFFVIYLRTNFKEKIKFSIFCIISLIIFALIMHNYILSIWDRFTYSNGDFINSISTGRDTIWIEYLKQWCKSPISFLFGQGLLTAEPFISAHNNMMASHNLYLFLLYRFGLIGSLILLYCLYLMIKTIGKKPIYVSAFLPIAWFILESFCDNTFKVFNIMLLVISLMALFENPDKSHQTNNKKSNKNFTKDRK